MQKLDDELHKKIEAIKQKYNELDAQTKKKIMAGIAGLTALVIGGAAVKKAMRKKK